MAAYDYKPIRWPVEITAANNKIEIYETADPAGNKATATLAVGWYLVDGTGNLIGISDLLAQVNTQLATAGASLGLGNPIQIQMNTIGRIQYKAESGDPQSIDWATSTFDKALLGVEDSETFTDISNDTYSAAIHWGWSAGGQWSPGVPEVHYSAEPLKHSVSESDNVRGRPSRVTHTPTASVEVVMAWDRIHTARVIKSRADVQAYADIVGRIAGDPDVWE
ncbi:MAG: hypothetical protein JRG95_25235, partial [Deltaproteobacteria bacterium]|nr:hypothetical protein [Deltaproteobacteria bacterium]